MMTLRQQTRIAIYIAVDNGPDNLQRLIDTIIVLVMFANGLWRFITGAIEMALSAVDWLAAGVIAVETIFTGWSIRWQMTILVIGLLFYEIRSSSIHA